MLRNLQLRQSLNTFLNLKELIMKTLLLIALVLSIIGLFTAIVYFFKLIKLRLLLKEEPQNNADFEGF